MSSEKGFSLIENLVAMTVLAVIGLIILSGLWITARSDMISNEHTKAESLARSQMDYIQDQPYSTSNPPAYAVIPIPPDCQGYSFASPMATYLDSNNNEVSNDYGLQKISITVIHNNKTVLTLEDFKANR